MRVPKLDYSEVGLQYRFWCLPIFPPAGAGCRYLSTIILSYVKFANEQRNQPLDIIC